VFFPQVNIILKILFASLLITKRQTHRDVGDGGAKLWICQADAYGLTDRRAVQVMQIWGELRQIRTRKTNK